MLLSFFVLFLERIAEPVRKILKNAEFRLFFLFQVPVGYHSMIA